MTGELPREADRRCAADAGGVERTRRANTEATWLATSLVLALGVVLTVEALRLISSFQDPVAHVDTGAGFWAMLGVLPGLVVAGVGNLHAARRCDVLPRAIRALCGAVGGASVVAMVLLAVAIA